MEIENKTIRANSAAGEYYPKEPAELSKKIASMFSEASKKVLDGDPTTLIVPQAGYDYSGKTATKAYKAIQGNIYDTVVVITASNTVFFQGSSVYDGDGYQTPLGIVEIDHDLSEKISNISPLVYQSAVGHGSGKTRGEHGIEVQLPFLQVLLGRFKLVAIVLGDLERDSISALGNTLSIVLRNKKNLLVVSSNLSQFHSETVIRELDDDLKKTLHNTDANELMNKMENGEVDFSGSGVLSAAIIANKLNNSKTFMEIDYCTSGETTGDFEEVVGYLSAVYLSDEVLSEEKPLIGSAKPLQKEHQALSEEDKLYLRTISYNSVIAKLKSEKFEPKERDTLLEKRSVFIELKVDGLLHSQMGRLRIENPLYQAASDIALLTAFEDPRVEPLSIDRIDNFELEISVLSKLKLERNFDKIKTGINGVMIKLDMNSALTLPQEAIRNNWSTTEMLEETCLKAGMGKNSYKDKFAEIFTFTAEVF